MASFVREVLSAAVIAEKDDFASKSNKIQKKLNDLKSQLSVHIHNRYSNFSSSLSHTTTINGQLERLTADIETLESSINKNLRYKNIIILFNSGYPVFLKKEIYDYKLTWEIWIHLEFLRWI